MSFALAVEPTTQIADSMDPEPEEKPVVLGVQVLTLTRIFLNPKDGDDNNDDDEGKDKERMHWDVDDPYGEKSCTLRFFKDGTVKYAFVHSIDWATRHQNEQGEVTIEYDPEQCKERCTETLFALRDHELDRDLLTIFSSGFTFFYLPSSENPQHMIMMPLDKALQHLWLRWSIKIV